MMTSEAILIFHTTKKLLGYLKASNEGQSGVVLVVCILYFFYIMLYLIFILQTNKVSKC